MLSNVTNPDNFTIGNRKAKRDLCLLLRNSSHPKEDVVFIAQVLAPPQKNMKRGRQQCDGS